MMLTVQIQSWFAAQRAEVSRHFGQRFFGQRGGLDLSRDRSSHRRYALCYDDLLA
ncbi:MAG: hypothetical protein AAFY10_00165 [Pseudomonadota bacterium]